MEICDMTKNNFSTTLNSRRVLLRTAGLMGLVIALSTYSTMQKADTGTCDGTSITLPFVDVPSASVFFCSIAEAFISGLTNGTDGTHYSPSAPVPREQMAAFVTRTMDQSVKRAGKRAALQQFWTIQGANNLTLTTVGSFPAGIQSDGADIWVANFGSATVSRVRGSDGKLLETWTGATNAAFVLCAMGKVFVTGQTNPGKLFEIDPTQTAVAVTTVTSALGSQPQGIAFDGQRIWTANIGGSVSIVTLNPVNVTTVTTGFSITTGILFDGANIWVTNAGDSSIKKLDSNGNILQSVTVGSNPSYPAFDGTNIWVPNISSSSVSVVRATGPLTGTVLATLTGNGLSGPNQAAFDGERMLITNGASSVSLWKASDLTPIGTFATGPSTVPFSACSDGVNFWITFSNATQIARF